MELTSTWHRPLGLRQRVGETRPCCFDFSARRATMMTVFYVAGLRQLLCRNKKEGRRRDVIRYSTQAVVRSRPINLLVRSSRFLFPNLQAEAAHIGQTKPDKPLSFRAMTIKAMRSTFCRVMYCRQESDWGMSLPGPLTC